MVDTLVWFVSDERQEAENNVEGNRTINASNSHTGLCCPLALIMQNGGIRIESGDNQIEMHGRQVWSLMFLQVWNFSTFSSMRKLMAGGHTHSPCIIA